MVLRDKLLPDSVMKVVLSGLLDSTWGSFSRSAIVRFFVYGNNVKIGIGEGSIHQWEIDALNASPIRHEWFRIKELNKVSVPGIKFVPGTKAYGMPRELIPVKSTETWIYESAEECAVFPAYRSFDINLGEGRTISIISPKTLIKDVVEAVHPAFPKEKFRGKVNNVEIDIKVLGNFIKKGYGIGILRKKGSIKIGEELEGFPVLGATDIMQLIHTVKGKGLSIDFK